MSIPRSIIFGPTGAVGSAAARTASQLGAPVVLAMRDTSKSIPGISPTTLASSQFERVYADLTKPETVFNAVKTTQAARAFIYVAHGSDMRSTVTALKDAGISLVVLLSSFTVRGTGAELGKIQPSEVIAYIHARVEFVLEEIFGPDGFVALRPGAFATNLARSREQILNGKVVMQGKKSLIDCIVPDDIGTVAGTILAKGPPSDGERRPYLYGPEIVTKEEGIKIIGRILGLGEIEVTGPSKDEAFEYLMKEGRGGETFARYYADQSAKDEEATETGSDARVFGYFVNRDLLQNVEKYSGRKATSLSEWVQKNRDIFQ